MHLHRSRKHTFDATEAENCKKLADLKKRELNLNEHPSNLLNPYSRPLWMVYLWRKPRVKMVWRMALIEINLLGWRYPWKKQKQVQVARADGDRLCGRGTSSL
jgi:hypothetical protein